MRNVIGLFVLMAMFSCSETGQRHGIEVLESWENGVVKKDRVNLAADTFIVNHYHDNYKLHMTGKAYYVDGVEVKHGEWKVLYPDGKNWSLNNFDKGIENGEYKTWYKNGKLVSSLCFSNRQASRMSLLMRFLDTAFLNLLLLTVVAT